MRYWKVTSVTLVLALLVGVAVAIAVEPNLPINCDNVEPYVCGESCVGYYCAPPAPITDLCKDQFAGGSSCVYWPGHSCCKEWFAIF